MASHFSTLAFRRQQDNMAKKFNKGKCEARSVQLISAARMGAGDGLDPFTDINTGPVSGSAC